jgi:hypothetical protein
MVAKDMIEPPLFAVTAGGPAAFLCGKIVATIASSR